MRRVPDLMFVNCCHLPDRAGGAQIYDRALFAAALAQALILTGVQCVVAAGWVVDDDAAATFATAFYEALLRGNRFIDAVAEARAAAYVAILGPPRGPRISATAMPSGCCGGGLPTPRRGLRLRGTNGRSRRHPSLV